MPVAKVAITIEESRLRELDRLVETGEFPNRSKAVNAALTAFSQQRSRKHRLLAELAKLDPQEEQELAGERFAGEAAWPEF